MTAAVAFDAMGTLFDLSGLEPRLAEAGAPAGALETWFARLLHAAAALTLMEKFEPFADIAETTLRSVLAQNGADSGRACDVVEGLAELDAYPEAPAALELLAEKGVRAIVLTNGSAENTKKLLARSSLERHVEAVVTTEEVRVYKPHPAIYRRALEVLELAGDEVTLVAAHGWDVAGAESAGLGAVWIDRQERVWPLPTAAAASAPDLVAAAELVLD
jgi:2-haloacid dehalogenase